jgi:methylated-DNA-[protein]-cysteine S-methyltransferase
MAKVCYNSPIGLIEITGTNFSISSLHFVEEKKLTHIEEIPLLAKCYLELEEYFNGSRKTFDVELDLHGTPFQKNVWEELLKIPFGRTVTYLELSKILGDEKAIRAVANANGKNEIPIIVPCHRVIGSDGSLTGYAGGLWRKKWLLEHKKKFSNYENQLSFSLQ